MLFLSKVSSGLGCLHVGDYRTFSILQKLLLYNIYRSAHQCC